MNKYYHVSIEIKDTGKKGVESEKYYELDKTNKQEVIDDIIIPYISNESFHFDGYTLNEPQIKRLKVKSSDKSTNELLKHEMSLNPNDIWNALLSQKSMLQYDNYMTDITKEILNEAKAKTDSPVKNTQKRDDHIFKKEFKKVFIVHGRDTLAKTETARLVEQLGLEAIILSEQENQGMTIIEKIEHYTDVNYGIVLYTPCDTGSLKGQSEIKPRARQNVIFEHGFLIGKLKRENVCALIKDEVEIPSDISGLMYINMDKEDWRYKIAEELKKAGFNIDKNNIK